MKGLDPLGPQNILIFATGPFQGSGIAGGGRHVVLGISPKTHAAADSYAGGFFGYELGRSGYDGLIFKGRAKTPVYLSLLDGKPELHDARDGWGKETADVEEKLQQLHGRVRAACIGPAGENLVNFACIIHDRTRSAGRPGFGAVMGSRNLKAIAIAGHQYPNKRYGHQDKPIHDKKAFLQRKKEFARALSRDTRARSQAPGGGGTGTRSLGLPFSNWTTANLTGYLASQIDIVITPWQVENYLKANGWRLRRPVRTVKHKQAPELVAEKKQIAELKAPEEIWQQMRRRVPHDHYFEQLNTLLEAVESFQQELEDDPSECCASLRSRQNLFRVN
jgi:transposase